MAHPPKPHLHHRPNRPRVPRRGLACALLRLTVPTTLPRPRGSLRRARLLTRQARRLLAPSSATVA